MNEIRVATAAEAGIACEVMRRSIRQICALDYPGDNVILSNWLRNKTPETIESWFRWPAHFPLVALRDNQLVGVAMLTRPGKIVFLHVDPASQSLGVGSRLLQSLESKARKSGMSVLSLTSTMSSRSFYERQGYAVTGPANAASGPALTMAKRLKTGAGQKARAGRCDSDALRVKSPRDSGDLGVATDRHIK